MKSLILAFHKLRETVSESKILIQRSMSYVSIINSGMILFLLLSRLQDYGLDIYITKWFIPIFILTILIMLFIGWLDTKLGFYSTETKRAQSRNPYMKEIISRLDKIEKKLDK